MTEHGIVRFNASESSAKAGRYPNLCIRGPNTNQGKVLSRREVFEYLRVLCISIVHSSRHQLNSFDTSVELARQATVLQQWKYHWYDALSQMIPPSDDSNVER